MSKERVRLGRAHGTIVHDEEVPREQRITRYDLAFILKRVDALFPNISEAEFLSTDVEPLLIALTIPDEAKRAKAVDDFLRKNLRIAVGR